MAEEKKEVPEITKLQLERDLANKKEELQRAEKNLVEHEEVLKLFEDLLPLLEETKKVL